MLWCEPPSRCVSRLLLTDGVVPSPSEECCWFPRPGHNTDVAACQSFEHYNVCLGIPCICLPVSVEPLSLFFGFQRKALQNLRKITGYTLEQKLPPEYRCGRRLYTPVILFIYRCFCQDQRQARPHPRPKVGA